jgi:hypothetical protein
MVTEVNDWLYSAHSPEQPNSRGHVADPELNKMLVTQRRVLDPPKRREIVFEIQRADKAYYVFLPNIPQYISHQPSVKVFRHHDGDGMGRRFMHTWLGR